jgi:hypothetical protein
MPLSMIDQDTAGQDYNKYINIARQDYNKYINYGDN